MTCVTTIRSTVPLAHFGHWTDSLIFGAPFLMLVVFVLVANFRDRRRERAGAGGNGRSDAGRASLPS